MRVRMAALMQLRVIFVYTHDSIGLGEDGPTHQPIEQLASLRAIPHMDLWRPCDARRDRGGLGRRASSIATGPTCLVFTRQALPHQPRERRRRSRRSGAAATC